MQPPAKDDSIPKRFSLRFPLGKQARRPFHDAMAKGVRPCLDSDFPPAPFLCATPCIPRTRVGEGSRRQDADR